MTELLPCPFCNANADLHIDEEACPAVICSKCDCQTTWYKPGCEEDAVAAWNSRATPADQEPVSGKDIWEYSFVHSSALGRPDERVTMLTYEKVVAFRPECFDQKLVCSAGMFVAEVSQDSDGFKHITDVVELDDIPAGTRLYAITSGNLPAAEKVDAGSVPVATRDMNCPKCHGVGHVPADGYGRDDCPVCFAAPQAPQSDAQSVRDAWIHTCGLPMSVNPHPEAGVPGRYLETGCQRECIPCLVLSRHQWSKRAFNAEKELRDLKSAPPQKRVSEEVKP